MNNKILIIPFIIFLAAFAFDKLILLGNFPLYYLTSISFINFQHKQEMIYELKNYMEKPHRKNVVVILGNSRSMSFDNQYIEKKYPGWILFNFSVPGGIQDYFLYLLKRFNELNIKPDALFISITPQGMNATPSVLTDEVLIYGLPLSFLLSEAEHYTISDWSNYIAKKLFVNYKFRPKLRVIQYRKDPAQLLKFADFIIRTYYTLGQERGSIPSSVEIKKNKNKEFLEKNAQSIWNDFFVPFKLSENAIYFLKKDIEYAKELNIKTIYLFWPPISPELLHKKLTQRIAIVENNSEKKTVYEVWFSKILEIAKEYDVQILDLNVQNQLKCLEFFDASHLASICYNEYTDKIFYELNKN